MMDCVATTDRLGHPESSKTVMRSVLATREGFGQIWLAVLGIFATGCDWLIKKISPTNSHKGLCIYF